MHPLYYNPNGLHLIETFGREAASALQECGVTDLLPGLIPEGDDPGDEWDDELTGIFAHIGE